MERQETERDVMGLRVPLSVAVPARQRLWMDERARALGFISISAYVRALIAHDMAAERTEREQAQEGEGGA